MSLNIRTATRNDVPLILRFIRELATYEKLGDEVTATEKMLDETLFGATPRAEVVIADYGGSPAGFALFFTNYSTFIAKPGLYLEDLFVDPAMRGKGIGKALLIHLAKLARERDYGRFEWTVLSWNEPAIGFYQSLGAQSMDGWIINRLVGDALDKVANS